MPRKTSSLHPFCLCSVDGVLLPGRETTTFAKRLAAKLDSKWEKTYSQGCGYVQDARLSIAILHAMHLFMRGSRVPVHKISTRYPQWEDGAAGLSLFEC